jgi:pimeloyl-ACP methyl ester carboxylesterase
MQVPRERIVLFGASDRAAAALEAAQRRPESIGMVVVQGVLGAPVLARDADREERLRAIRVLAFHGEHDRKCTPGRAREAIENAMGRAALRPPRGLWHVFPGEDHGLRSDAPHAAIHATILHELGLVDCEP